MNEIEASSKRLPKKADMFIRYILAGKPTVEAHKMAGYQGDAHAAYVLRSKLKPFIAKGVEMLGIDKEGLALDIARLDAVPVDTSNGITISDKLKLMDQKRKFIELTGGEKEPVLTRFVIKTADVVDVKPITQGGDEILRIGDDLETVEDN